MDPENAPQIYADIGSKPSLFFMAKLIPLSLKTIPTFCPNRPHMNTSTTPNERI